MQVAVIGGGVIGVCTAYFLAAAGHEVVVIERYGNVAQETSFGNAGIIAPGYSTPWAAPGMPKKILSYLFKREAPVLFKPSIFLAAAMSFLAFLQIFAFLLNILPVPGLDGFGIWEPFLPPAAQRAARPSKR